MIIIGDVHGCLESLKALLSQLPKGKDVCFVGDLIDRGPHSKEVIQLVIKNNYHCVLGNHELVMLKWWNEGYRTELNFSWASLGGIQTFVNYQNDIETLEKHIEWIRKLPGFLEFRDIKNEAGKHLLVSHSSLEEEDIAKSILNESLFWNRSSPYEMKDVFNVFGHTPAPQAIIGDFFANIDTGCCYGNMLTALEFPEMNLYMQPLIDSFEGAHFNQMIKVLAKKTA